MHSNFETLLSKDIAEASFIGDMVKLDQNDMYYIANPRVLFFDYQIGQVLITVSENESIESVTLFLTEIEDKKSLYEPINEVYGAGEIMVFDEVIYDGQLEEFNDHTSSKAKETIFSLKKGKMTDNVNHILWVKEDFQIMYKFGDKKGNTFVRFSLNLYN